MPRFSKISKARLATCHPDLREVLDEAIATATPDLDFSVICGHRSKLEQNAAYERGASKLRYPRSKHNSFPSVAVDVAPWPIDWNDLDRFQKLAEHIFATAERLGVRLRWGGTWTSNPQDPRARFCDMPHFELIQI